MTFAEPLNVEIMKINLMASPTFTDTNFSITSENGKIHFNAVRGDYGQGLLRYVGSDALYLAFYYNENDSYLSMMCNIGSSKTNARSDAAIKKAVAEIGVYRADTSAPGTFSLSRYGVTPENLDQLFSKLLKDVEYILRAASNPSYQ